MIFALARAILSAMFCLTVMGQSIKFIMLQGKEGFVKSVTVCDRGRGTKVKRDATLLNSFIIIHKSLNITFCYDACVQKMSFL